MRACDKKTNIRLTEKIRLAPFAILITGVVLFIFEKLVKLFIA